MIEHLAVFRFGSWMPKDLAPGPAGRLFALSAVHCALFIVNSRQWTGDRVYSLLCAQFTVVCVHIIVYTVGCEQCSLNTCFGSWLTEDFGISPTAGGGGLELKLHEVPTTDSSQVRRVQVQVLELGRGVLELKLHEEESKYTEA